MAKTQSNNRALTRWIVVLMAITLLLTACLLMFITDKYLGLPFTQTADGDALIYAFPEGAKSSELCKVLVNGRESYVHDVMVNYSHNSPSGNAMDKLDRHPTPVTSFDMDGSVKVEVTLPDTKIKSAIVTPQSYNIRPSVSGKKVTFVIREPGQYTVEFNGSQEGALHIFANAMAEAPDLSDPNLIYIGPGIYRYDEIVLKSNQTLYLDGNAIVYGYVKSDDSENITIAGHGYLDGSIYPRYKEDGVSTNHKVPINLGVCKNVNISGISCLDPAGWAYNLYHCENVAIDNIKIISSRQNGDGISVQSCNNVTVTDSFTRTWDDSLVVKAYEGNTTNVFFDNCVIWNDLAQCCEVGYETRGDLMKNIWFTNITVLHANHKAVVSLHCGDHATVSDVHYENIVVEDMNSQGDGANFLIDLLVDDTIWTKEMTRGQIDGVTIKNVSITGGNMAASRIHGYSTSNTVKNVTIENVTMLGKKVDSLVSGNFVTNPFIGNIVFK